MKRTRSVLALVTAGALALGAAPLGSNVLAQGNEKEASTVTIVYDDSHKFKGSVDAWERCTKWRQIVLKRHRRGRNPIVARDRSNKYGNWKTSREFRNGRYYAIVRHKVVQNGEGETVECMRDRSTTEKI